MGMKTILTGTDFSSGGNHATLYAADLANALHHKLIVAGAYQLPPATSYETPLVSIGLEDLRRGVEEGLLDTANQIKARHPSLAVETLPVYGDGAEALSETALSIGAEMVVVGTTGRTALERFLLGSTTRHLTRISPVPVLCIPPDVDYVRPERVVFGFDPDDRADWPLPKAFTDVIAAHKSRLIVVSVLHDGKIVNPEQAVHELLLEHHLEGIEHTYQFPTGEPEEGLISTATALGAQWLVLRPRYMSLLDRIIHRSVTNAVLSTTFFPVLCLPSK
jgi:nucleotide-binding universal stress UspA family protein